MIFVNDKENNFFYNFNHILLSRGGREVSITSYEFFTNIYHLRDEEVLRIFVNATVQRHLKKGEFVVKPGEIQKDVYLMEYGIFRGYFVDANGRELTDCIRYKCGTVALAAGELKPDPSPMAIEMLEEGSFFCIPMSVLASLQETHIEVVRLYNKLLISAFNEHWGLKQVLAQYNSTQRYQWFLENFPGIIERINNKYIASFLGMAPETFSRLRRSIREGQGKPSAKADPNPAPRPVSGS